MRLTHPYDNLSDCLALRGNLHAHSTRSDGSRSPQAVVDEYRGRGYDFLMLSDHDTLSAPADYAALDTEGLVVISGNEVSANGPHMLHVAATALIEPAEDRQAVLDTIEREGGFAIVNHPNWYANFNHCSIDRLREWTGYAGIEIFNGVIGRLEGSQYATDKWDMLLSEGRRVWGYAHDDSHAPGDDALGWNVVYAADRTPDAIIDALRTGRFYASTGVTIDNITVAGETIRLETTNAQRIVAVMQNAVRLQVVDASHIELVVPPTAKYVRFECWGVGESFAWTQPFFVEPTEA